MKTRDEMEAIGDEFGLSTYHIKQAQSIGHEISTIMSKVEMLNSLVGEELLDEELYKNFAERQKKDIKNLIAQLYANMELDKVRSSFDRVFESNRVLTEIQKNSIEKEYKYYWEIAEHGHSQGISNALSLLGEKEFSKYLEEKYY